MENWYVASFSSKLDRIPQKICTHLLRLHHVQYIQYH